MKLSKLTLPFLVVSLTLMLSLVAKAQSWGQDNKDTEQKMKLLGTIPIPGPKPIASTDIMWADQTTGKVFFSDRSNSGVEIIDGRHDLFVGRVTTNGVATTVPPSAAGTLHFQGLTSPSTHEGPNGVVSTPDKKAWAGDGDSTVKVIDVDPSSPTYLQIIAQISTAGLTRVSNCTGGPTGTCNRADEIAYDSEQNIIVVADDEPTGIQPFLTFISAQAPYTVLGQMNFEAQGLVASGGLEQPVWDEQIHRFLQTLPVTDSTTGTGAIAVFKVTTSPSFSATVERTISTAGFNCSPSGEALSDGGHLVVACAIPGAASGSPTTFPLVLDVATGHEVGDGINEVGGGDEVNYNPGENEFVVSSSLDGVTAGPGNPTVLGVINANSGDWIENVPPATAATSSTALGTGGLATSGRAGNLAAFGGNKHVFVVVHPAAAPATDVCGFFGTTTTTTTATDFGCVAVFGPVLTDDDHKGW
jgi:hypothetical protein